MLKPHRVNSHDIVCIIWNVKALQSEYSEYVSSVNQNVKSFLILPFRGDSVEDVFIETAKKIYQNIQDGK